MRILHAMTLVAAALALPVLAADEFPKLKSGQWEIQMIDSKGSPPTKTTLCTDDAVQKDLIAMGTGMQKEMCSKNDLKREGSRVISTSECKIGDSTIITKAVMTFTGDVAYRTEIDSTYSPPFMGMKNQKTTLEGKHVGACRDGLVPGDVVLPGGQKMNLKNIGSARKPAAAAKSTQ